MVTFTVMSSGVTSAASAAKAFGDTYLRLLVAHEHFRAPTRAPVLGIGLCPDAAGAGTGWPAFAQRKRRSALVQGGRRRVACRV